MQKWIILLGLAAAGCGDKGEAPTPPAGDEGDGGTTGDWGTDDGGWGTGDGGGDGTGGDDGGGDGTGTGTDVGGALLHPDCVLSTSAPVSDIESAYEETDYSIRVVLLAAGGLWRGTITWANGGEDVLTLLVATDTVRDAQWSTWVNGGTDSSITCPSGYLFTVDGTLNTESGPILQENYTTQVFTGSPTSAQWKLLIPVAELGGTLRPQTVDVSLWEATALRGDLTFKANSENVGSWFSTLEFAPIEDDGMADTGTPEAESVGTFDLPRMTN